MNIKLDNYSYESEKCAIAAEIIRHLRSIGINVEVRGNLSEDPANNIVLKELAQEQFPVIIDIY